MAKSEMIVSLLSFDLMTVRHLSTYIWPYTIIFLLTPRCWCAHMCVYLFLHCFHRLHTHIVYIFPISSRCQMSNNNKFSKFMKINDLRRFFTLSVYVSVRYSFVFAFSFLLFVSPYIVWADFRKLKKLLLCACACACAMCSREWTKERREKRKMYESARKNQNHIYTYLQNGMDFNILIGISSFWIQTAF